MEQNRRHIEVLQAFVRDHNLSPKRLGLSLPIRFHNCVLVSPKCQVRRGGGEWDHVVKIDLFEKRFGEYAQATSFFDTLSSVSKLVSLETLEGIGRRLIEAHTPAKINFAAKLGIGISIGNLNTTANGRAALSSAQPERVSCEKCSTPVDAQVIKYCRINVRRFSGKVLCRSCQQHLRSAPCCSTGGAPVDNKVVAFCRFNSKRFGKKLLCRNCQTTPALSAIRAPHYRQRHAANDRGRTRQPASRDTFTGKILALSAHLSAENRAAYVALRVDGMIPKPFDLHQFRTVVTAMAGDIVGLLLGEFQLSRTTVRRLLELGLESDEADELMGFP